MGERCPIRRRLALALFLLLVLPSIACSPNAPTVQLNEAFVLAPGETASVEDSGISIRFVRVTGDSRCPADALCIQGGDALVQIEVSSSIGGGTQAYDLHTGDLRPVFHNGLTIQLVLLLPYPFSSQTIRPDDYRATFRVIR